VVRPDNIPRTIGPDGAAWPARAGEERAPGSTTPVAEDIAPPGGAGTPRPDLESAVARIAQSAAKRVAILDKRHVLSDEQRGRIFHVFARDFAARQGLLATSEEPLPAETVPADAGTAPDEAGRDISEVESVVYELLDEDQQDSYVDAAVERDLWWAEVIAVLADGVEAPLAAPATASDPEGAAGTGETTAEDTAGDTGGEASSPDAVTESAPQSNLFDLMLR